MKVKGFLLEGDRGQEFLLTVQPAKHGVFERLAVRQKWEGDWTDAQSHPQLSRTSAAAAVLSYIHRLWQACGPHKVLDH